MRRVWIGLGVALVVLGAGDTAAWYWATARIAEGFAAWEQARRAEGWTVQSGPALRAGWPLSASVVVPRLTLSFVPQAGEPRVTWRAERLIVGVRADAPDQLRLRPLGAQSVALGDGAVLAYRADFLLATVPLEAGTRVGTATALARGLRSGDAAAGPAIGSARLRLRWDETAGAHRTAASLRVDVRAVRLPAGVRWPLGRRVAAFALHGTLDGPVPPPGDLTARVRAWQHSDGRMVLHHMDLRWGPLSASLEARLGLDASLQPMGTGQAMVSGYAQALDTLAANGALPNDAALAGKAMLSVMATPPGADGAPAEITLPLTLKGGVLSLRGVPLLRLPPLPWPGDQPG
jgi:hypothetical protein